MKAAYLAIMVATCAGLVPGRLAAQQVSPAVDQPVMRVTTDTRAYCDHLLARIAEVQETRPTPLPRANMLAIEGRRMCAGGLVRPGIARLRRALVLLRTQH